MKHNCVTSLQSKRALLSVYCSELQTSYVFWISILEAHVFTVKNRSFPNSFWQNSPLLWLALRNNSWLHGKYCQPFNQKQYHRGELQWKYLFVEMIQWNISTYVRRLDVIQRCVGRDGEGYFGRSLKEQMPVGLLSLSSICGDSSHPCPVLCVFTSPLCVSCVWDRWMKRLMLHCQMSQVVHPSRQINWLSIK